MSKIILIFVGGVVVGVLFSWLFLKLKTHKAKKSLIQIQAEEKALDKRSILGIMETNSPLTNNHIEMMLGIPESSTTRYLDELEKEGKVVQHGTTGRDVFYTLR